MAGGFFSGGSSDSVNASVAEAEAAARRAEEAEARLEGLLTPFTGQNVSGDYTVPQADDLNNTTKFLNQSGLWAVPAGSSGAETLNDLTDVTVASPAADQFLQYNGTEWVNVAVDPADPLTAGTGLDITNNVVSIEDDGVVTALIADNAVTSAKIPAGGVARTNIADNAIDDSKLNATNTGTADQILTAVGDGSFTWVDAAGETTYTASEGLTLVSDDFQIASDGVTTAKIVDDAITSAKILDDNVTADELNVTGDGTSGQILSSDGDGSFTWIDNNGGSDTTYTADETTLTLSDTNVFSVEDEGIDTAQIAGEAVNGSKLDATNSPTIGQFLTAAQNNTFTWVTPAEGTAYTAGTGLDLTGDEFSIADDGVDTAQIADNAVDADKLNVTGDGNSGQFLASDGDGSFTWTASTNSLEGLTDTNIPAGGPSVRSFLEYNTTDDTWDATAATEFLNIAELFDVDITNIANNQFLRYNSTDDRWENETVTIPANLTFTAPLSRSGTTVSLPNGSINTDQLADNAVDADKLSVDGTSGQILSTNSSGDLAWIDADGNTAYTASEGLTLVSDDFQIAADGVTNDKLADNSVRTENIVNGTIVGADLSNSAVDTLQIADDAVTAAKIADGTITAAQVANNTLTAVQLATDSVTSFKIQDGAVIASKIPDGSITEPKLSVTNAGEDGQILSRAGTSFTWIDDAGGTDTTYTADETTLNLNGTTFSIADQGVDTTQIAANAITGTQLADGAVNTAELEDSAVETAKINDGAVTNAKLGTGAVNTSKIFDGAITNVKLGSSSVTTVKINNNAVNASKLSTDIPISTFNDVNTTGVNNGQILTYNGTTWVPTNNSGGGNTDNSRLGIALNPTSLNVGDADTSITVTLSIVDQISGETASGQSVTVTDPTGHSVAVSGSGNDWTFTASTANAGNFVIRGHATFTTSNASSVHTASANLPVHATNTDWYQWVTDNQPTAITSTGVVDNGVFSSPETGTWTRPTEDTDNSEMAYVALPTRENGYTFHAGLLFATITDLGVISTDYTLYSLDDFAQVEVDESRIITITEA